MDAKPLLASLVTHVMQIYIQKKSNVIYIQLHEIQVIERKEMQQYLLKDAEI